MKKKRKKRKKKKKKKKRTPQKKTGKHHATHHASIMSLVHEYNENSSSLDDGVGMSTWAASNAQAVSRSIRWFRRKNGMIHSFSRPSNRPMSLLRSHMRRDALYALSTVSRRNLSYALKTSVNGSNRFLVKIRENRIASSNAYAADSSRGGIYRTTASVYHTWRLNKKKLG